MRFIVYFVCIDHSSDDRATKEQTIVEAESAHDAGKKFYSDSDMSGCYVEEIVPLTW